MQPAEFSVSQFIDVCNQTLEYAYENVVVVGEVSGFKVNQGKWVFFDLKDEDSSISCFMAVWELRQPLEDGMKVRVRGVPKLTKWGKFSFTVRQVMPVGEGNIKKSFELLKKKLSAEGLFAPEKKRPLPSPINKIGVISSVQAAGYADFIKIIGERWGGLEVQVCHTQVQGMAAADQIIRALKYLNEHGEVDVIAIIRGGGSADDLAVFNDEQMVRAIAASKIPVITGIGHEIDESLADLAADVVASTPSNAAQMLTPDRRAIISNVQTKISHISSQISIAISSAEQNVQANIRNVNNRLLDEINGYLSDNKTKFVEIHRHIDSSIDAQLTHVQHSEKLLESLNPERVLEKGYAIIRGEIDVGQDISLETSQKIIDAKITNVKEK